MHELQHLLCKYPKGYTKQVPRCFRTVWSILIHLGAQQTGHANPTLASAAQASSKWMEVNLGDSALRTLQVQQNKKLFTTLIHKPQNRPGTSFGIVPGLPISPYWPPVDKNWVSLHATFLQNKLPTSEPSFRSDVGIPCRASQRKTFLQVAKLQAKRNINRPLAILKQIKL